jgi:hypothetical protein
VNGAALDHSKQAVIGYTKNPDVLYVTGAPGNANHSFTSADDAVHAAALDVLQNLEVIGGNLLMKRAHQNSPSNIPETASGNGAPTLSAVSTASQLVTMSAFENGPHLDRNRRVKARRDVRAGGWRRTQQKVLAAQKHVGQLQF